MKKRYSFILGALLLLFTAELSARPWKQICASGKLMVLTADIGRNEKGLHRIVMPIDREQALLYCFAQEHNLQLQYIPAKDFKTLFDMLEAGKGDLISANLAATPSRKAKYLLSNPFDYTREMVFTSIKSPVKGNTPADLQGLTGWLLPDTTYASNFRLATAGQPDIKVNNLPTTISHDDLIELVASGKIAYSVLNECDLDVWAAFRPDIRKLFPVKKQVSLVFAAKKNDTKLIAELNKLIGGTVQPSVMPSAQKKKSASTLQIKKNANCGDLSAIRKRGYIRMITTNDLYSCYLHKGVIAGFEYELAKRFAEQLHLMVVTVIPPAFKDMTSYLAEGKGDFIAANFSMTPERIRQFPGLAFCSPYAGASQVLVGRPGEKITKISELAGRRIHVRKGNSYYATLCNLQKKGIRLIIVPVQESEAGLATLWKVAEGKYDLTLIDDTFLRTAQNSGCKVKKLFPLTEVQPFAWVVRKNNPQLQAEINKYFKKENKSTFFNLCKSRYYGVKKSQEIANIPLNSMGKISPYDAIFQKYAKRYDFKWYLLAAQSYRESQFKTNLVNHIGATGLMQIMPKTANELGFTNLTNPDNGIHAGTKYMHKLRTRFSDDKITPINKICFSLASYNAGYGHVQDARKLAARMGLNPNIWANNTEKALKLLEHPQYASQAKYGFCRASETVPYVNNIILQTYQYQKILDLQKDKIKKIKSK